MEDIHKATAPYNGRRSRNRSRSQSRSRGGGGSNGELTRRRTMQARRIWS